MACNAARATAAVAITLISAVVIAYVREFRAVVGPDPQWKRLLWEVNRPGGARGGRR